MDRKGLESLAQERLGDAEALLGLGRWSAAYYLCGYAVECALKSCVLKYLGESDKVFGDETYLKRLAGCWTHDLAKLVNLAGLDAEFGVARGANPALKTFWEKTIEWNETSRYSAKTEAEAKDLFEAIGHTRDGVFQWIRSRW